MKTYPCFVCNAKHFKCKKAANIHMVSHNWPPGRMYRNRNVDLNKQKSNRKATNHKYYLKRKEEAARAAVNLAKIRKEALDSLRSAQLPPKSFMKRKAVPILHKEGMEEPLLPHPRVLGGGHVIPTLHFPLSASKPVQPRIATPKPSQPQLQPKAITQSLPKPKIAPAEQLTNPIESPVTLRPSSKYINSKGNLWLVLTQVIGYDNQEPRHFNLSSDEVMDIVLTHRAVKHFEGGEDKACDLIMQALDNVVNPTTMAIIEDKWDAMCEEAYTYYEDSDLLNPDQWHLSRCYQRQQSYGVTFTANAPDYPNGYSF